MAETRWQQLSKSERKTLLKKFFFDVLFSHPNLPAFMTDQDWSDLYKETQGDIIKSHPSEKNTVVVFVETFAYTYWVEGSDKFHILMKFLLDTLTKAKVGEFDVFQSSSEQNLFIWFTFNMPAVYDWMAQQV